MLGLEKVFEELGWRVALVKRDFGYMEFIKMNFFE